MESNFETTVLAHADAAYNLARWLTRNDQDAQDVVQEASLRALAAFGSFRGGDARVWLLTIVRNTAFTLLKKNKAAESLEDCGQTIAADAMSFDPHAIAVRAADVQCVRKAINELPPLLRETIVLREMEGLSYRQIASVAGVPIGTVMSRLARGRRQLQEILAESHG
jgi:RNA polymerase sigma-70 factor, ECF subfamily